MALSFSTSTLHHIRGRGHGSYWHLWDVQQCLLNGRYRRQSGHAADIAKTNVN